MLRTHEATRWGRNSQSELDYFCCNRAFLEVAVPEDGALHVTCHPSSRTELGSDHCCISLVVALRGTPPASSPPCQTESKKRKRGRPSKCGRWRVDAEKLQSTIHEVCHQYAEAADLRGKWEVLTSSARRVSYPKGSLKHVDSPSLKALCLSRRLATDPSERTALTRHIVSLRHVEKTCWLQSLHQRSREGDAQAIKYLKQRYSPYKGSTDTFVESSGGLSQAATALQNHYRQVFQRPVSASQQAMIDEAASIFSQRACDCPSPDFTIDEIQACINRLKWDRTSGPSGMSNEYLVAFGN